MCIMSKMGYNGKNLHPITQTAAKQPFILSDQTKNLEISPVLETAQYPLECKRAKANGTIRLDLSRLRLHKFYLAATRTATKFSAPSMRRARFLLGKFGKILAGIRRHKRRGAVAPPISGVDRTS